RGEEPPVDRPRRRTGHEGTTATLGISGVRPRSAPALGRTVDEHVGPGCHAVPTGGGGPVRGGRRRGVRGTVRAACPSRDGPGPGDGSTVRPRRRFGGILGCRKR